MDFFRRLPDWRTTLVWRLYGWAAVQEILVLGGSRSWTQWFESAHWSLNALSLCALLLIGWGPSPALLVATSAASSALFWVTASGTDPYLNFPGAELPLFTAMPVGSVLLWAMGRARRAGDDDITRSMLSLYQLAFVVEMGFAGLHKLNADFLDPEISCAGVLNVMLPQWWDSPLASLAHVLDPVVVLGFEFGMPLLSILYWPVGLLVCIGFLLGLAMVGPTGFTAVSLAAAFGFVRGTTPEAFYRFPRRHPVVVVVGAAALAVYVAWTHRAPPDFPWRQFALYAVVVGFLAVCLLGELWRDLRGRRPGGAWAALRLSLPRAAALRATLAAVLVIGVVNGLTPYFGYKYHFSFSMLSNLRADGVRWNSLVVPRGLRMVDVDPFVEVMVLVVEEGDARPARQDLELFEAHWPPYEFVKRVKYHLWLGHELHLNVRYLGEERVFPNVSTNDEAKAFLAELPRSLLFQKVLVDGPQPCVH